MTAADINVGHIQISVEMNNCRNLLETAAVDDCLVPDVPVTRMVEIVSLDYPETDLLLALVALNIDEKTILSRSA